MGKNISDLSHKQAAELRNRHIGFIFQVYNLLPVYTVFENVEFALILQNIGKAERKKMVMDALEWVGLENMADKKPAKISGGEGQRVAIARAMVTRPALLLADEPTGNLDTARSQEIMELLTRLNKEQGLTIVLVTHEKEMAAFARRKLEFRDGHIVNEWRAEAA